jgi:hypothetical protein
LAGAGGQNRVGWGVREFNYLQKESKPGRTCEPQAQDLVRPTWCPRAPSSKNLSVRKDMTTPRQCKIIAIYFQKLDIYFEGVRVWMGVWAWVNSCKCWNH